MATFRLGASLAEQGRLQEGIAKMRDGLAAWKNTGAELERPYRLSVLAKAYGQLGQTELALGLLAEALVAVSTSGEGFWEAELRRLKGELLLAQSDKDQLAVEECFHQAIDVARRQQAKLLELRAVTSLSRLWQRQGKSERARRILGGVYGWFTEGFDTADLTDAKRLLDELSAS
jgi:predicted ATPase